MPSGLVPSYVHDVKSIARFSSGGWIQATCNYTYVFEARGWSLRMMQVAVRALQFALDWAVTRAKQIVHVDTGRLRDSIHAKPIRAAGDGVSGEFGSFDVRYAIWHEIGSLGRPGVYYIRQAAAEAIQLLQAMLGRGGAGGRNFGRNVIF